MPWRCELPHGHDGEHDMPNVRALGLFDLAVTGEITWFEYEGVTT